LKLKAEHETIGFLFFAYELFVIFYGFLFERSKLNVLLTYQNRKTTKITENCFSDYQTTIFSD
jgi:hypothetical protein